MSDSQLIDELEKIFSERPFLSREELLDLGIFISISEIKRAEKIGLISFFEISPRLAVVPASILLKYLINRSFEKFK